MRLRLSKEGLTLVELLVVIGIIAVLAGIIWVVLAPVKRKATLLICRNNFRQIYLAVKAYREDYEGIEPDGRPLTREDVGLPTPSLFFGLIKGGYIKDRRILNCPEETELKQISAKIRKRSVSSYLYPANLPYDLIPQHFSQCISLKRSEVAILGDPWHNPPKPSYAPIEPTPFFPQWELILRLNGQIDLVFVKDGKACR
jgi:prepilin-type N-terminal cleavage/methylation domain-containing protein